MRVGDIIADTEWMPGKDYGKDSPHLTVILPTFRRCQSGMFLNSAKSVLNQSLRELELIIVDDASTDGTADQIKELMRSDGRVSCLRHPRNVGLPAISEYEGLKKARGQYLGFAFDDGTFLPEAFEALLKQIKSKQARIIRGYITLHYHDPHTNESGQGFLGQGYAPQSNLLSHNYIPNNAVLIDKALISESGFFDPHICMSRLCDWDLWRRISEDFHFPDVDVCVGEEFGPLTNDSLGKTRLMDVYTVSEWMSLSRNKLLTPDVIEDYDVVDYPKGLSARAKSVINEIATEFRAKFWHPDNRTNTTIAVAKGQRPILEENRELSDDGRILVVCWCMDATVLLYFKELELHFGCRVRLALYPCYQPYEMTGSSAVIFVRVLPKSDDPWIILATKLGVPIYYYCDDNFCVLAEEGDRSFEEYTPQTVKERLKPFAGVLLSTHSLIAYYNEKQLHSQLYYYPPIIRSFRSEIDIPRNTQTFRVAFFGGTHRSGPFHKLVLPALQQLAKSLDVELILPIDLNSQSVETPKGLKVIPVPRDISYTFVLKMAASLHPHVLVHPSSKTRNNKYKTLNCLINACSMGAAPILAATDPFLDLQGTDIAMLCEDSIDSWYQALKTLATDTSIREKLRHGTVEYCKTHYSGNDNINILKLIINNSPIPGRCMTEARLVNCLRMVQKDLRDLRIAVLDGRANTASSVPALSEMKHLVPKADLPYDYSFACNELSLSGVSFYVGTHDQKLSGTLNARLFDSSQKHLLRETTLDLAGVQDNSRVTVNFPKLDNTKGSRLHLKLTANTTQRISLYCLPKEGTGKVSAAVNKLLRKPWKMFLVMHP